MSRDRDELLAGWLDGELSPDETAEFQQMMASDPGLAARAERWRAGDTRIAAALLPIADVPVDDDMLARLGLAEPAASAPVAAAAPLAANDNSPWWRRNALPLGGALAASLALVALLVPRQAQLPQDDLSIALETTPSLGEAKLADGREVQPTLTVRAADGRYCREYRIADAVALACRGEGGWKVEAEGKGAGPDSGAEIGLASGAGTQALDAAYRRLGASDPLDGQAEAALIGKRWATR